jgi:major membrane immunogen (membrane-anchored lipoprotein)
MKNYKLLLAMSVLALFLAGCGISKMVKTYPNVNIKLENQDLENKGGKVDYTVKAITSKYLKKNFQEIGSSVVT